MDTTTSMDTETLTDTATLTDTTALTDTATLTDTASTPKKRGYGTPIERKAAQAYITNFDRLREALSENVLPNIKSDLVVSDNQKPAKPQEIKNLYGSNYNGFMFSKEAVDRFFELGAEYLLVLLGAKQETGYPTIVLVGCNQDVDGKTFHSLDIDKVATEQPPRMVVPVIPAVKEKVLSFIIQ